MVAFEAWRVKLVRDLKYPYCFALPNSQSGRLSVRAENGQQANSEGQRTKRK
jgi:hypothetical protein